MSLIKSNYCLATAIGLSANLVFSSQALAQIAESKGGIEEVQVSARRTQESMQSTPVTVTAFGAAALREKSISTPEDLQMSTPGVFLSGTGSRQNVIYQIRGQSKSVFGANSPAVVSYFAEVPDPVVGSFVPQYDLRAVEVLKGPQGTLFGRNTTGGAILYSPEAPTYDLNGYISGTVGSYNKREIQGAVSLPLVDNKIALRIAGDIDRRDGFTKNLDNDSEIDNIDSKAWRLSLLVEPTERLSNSTIYDYYHSKSGGTAQVIADVFGGSNLLSQLGLQSSALQQLAQQRSWGPFKSNAPLDFDGQKNERTSLINRTEYRWENIELINIVGYRESEVDFVVNTDGMGTLTADGSGALPLGTPVNYIKANLNNGVKQTSDELQLRGELDNGKIDWLVGAFWLKSVPSDAQGSSVAFAQIPGLSLAAPNYNFIEEESKAIFAHVTYDLSDWTTGLQFELGVRYTEDDTESCTGNGVNTAAGPLLAASDEVSQSDCRNAAANVANASVNKTSSDQYTWSAGLNWQVTDDLYSYLVTRHGYRAGGANGPTLTGRLSQFQTFTPEEVTDIEWGVRADWAVGDVDVRTNLSAFFGRYSDVQAALTGVQTATGFCDPSSANPPGISPDGDCNPNNDPAGGTLLINIGESQVSGVNFDFQVSLTRNLRLSLGGEYLDLSTREFDLPDTLAPYLSVREIPFDLVAEKSITAGARYELPSVPFAESMVFNLEYYWTDAFTFAGVELPGYGVSNMRIDINSVANSGFDLSFSGRNILDKEYIASGSAAGAFIGINSAVYGGPRTLEAELRYRF